MRLINPSVTMITETDPFKKIERVGRTCYKSEDKITEDSSKKFYRSLISRKHTAMVEHATFVFKVDHHTFESLLNSDVCKFLNFSYNAVNGRYLVSGNLRAINECRSLNLCKALYDLDPELVYSEYDKSILETYNIQGDATLVNLSDLGGLNKTEFLNHAYYTFHFICDRGVTHEMVRHRPASFAQESTRYCNYEKEKFGGEITFIKPAGWDEWKDIAKFHACNAFDACEVEYMTLIRCGMTPQQARAVLPNALKTEIIMTANAKEWEHFFDLRSRGVTGAPHPDMKVVADMALTLYEIEKIVLLGP